MATATNQLDFEETGFELEKLRELLQNYFMRCNVLLRMYREHLDMLQFYVISASVNQNYSNLDINLRREHEFLSLDIAHFNAIQANTNLHQLLLDYQKNSDLYFLSCDNL